MEANPESAPAPTEAAEQPQSAPTAEEAQSEALAPMNLSEPAPAAESSSAPDPSEAEPAAPGAESSGADVEETDAVEATMTSDADADSLAAAEAVADGDASAAAAAQPEDPLSRLAEETTRRRLSPADEETLTKLLKEALLDGRVGVGRAIEHLPKVPWVVAVNAVTDVWQEMKPTFRTRLSAGLARIDSEPARRVRLSLARGLSKQDMPAALKIAVSVVKDMRERETGLITVKNAHVFANVFIGRAKPWVVQLPLGDLKPAEADLLVQVALLAIFSVPHPPATQLGLLKWSVEGGRLAKMPPAVLELVQKGLERWNGKWRGVLLREVTELPEALAEPLKASTPPPAAAPEKQGGRRNREEAPRADAPAEGESPAAPESETTEADAEKADSDDDEGDEDEDKETPAVPRPRPVYESKTMPNRGQRGDQREGRESRDGREGREHRDPRDSRDQRERSFNLSDSLRQIDQYVSGLRNELQAAQNRLRQREDDVRRRPERPQPVPNPAALSVDELVRLNQQLEARNAELQARLDELREDAEIRAASGRAPVEEGVPPVDPAEQLRTLLTLKLQDDHADFLALEQEAPDLVVRQHYPTLLRHVFEVLKGEGISLGAAAEPAKQN